MEPLIIIAVVVLIVAGIAWSLYAAAKRRQELAAWAASRGWRFDPDKDHSMRDRFPEFNCLRAGDQNRYAFNITTGELNGCPIHAFDYHYETVSTDSKGRRQTSSHYFSAVILDSALPLKELFIRPEGFFDKITEFFGYDDIDFESAEFSRKFYVKSSDRKWAYDVIHQRTMEFLLQSPTFTIQFDRRHVIAYRSSRFSTAEYDAAIGVIEGIFDRFPEYLTKQLAEGA